MNTICEMLLLRKHVCGELFNLYTTELYTSWLCVLSEMAGNIRKRDISRQKRGSDGSTKQHYVVDYLAIIDYAIFNR